MSKRGKKGHYTPRFSYDDFDGAAMTDKEMFYESLRRHMRRDKKMRDVIEKLDAVPKGTIE